MKKENEKTKEILLNHHHQSNNPYLAYENTNENRVGNE